MNQEMNAMGLCCTCNFNSECLSLKNSLKRCEPILFCEEFDDSSMETCNEMKVKRERRQQAHSFSSPIDFCVNL